MKLSIISDTHCQLAKVDLDSADVLIHAGDFTYRGNDAEISEFMRDLSEVAGLFKLIILVAGNHDWMCQTQKSRFAGYVKTVPNAVWLQDSATEFNGTKFYGTSWQPHFMDWAFGVYRGDLLEEKYSIIPKDTDVLITHCPPFGILDETIAGEYVGSSELRAKIEEIRPVINCFGHIHHSRGWLERFGVVFINASICDEKYRPTNKPIYVDIEGKRIKRVGDQRTINF